MFPELTSDRFFLLQIVPADQQFIFDGLSHPKVIEYYGVRFDTFESTNAQMQFYNQILQEGTGTWWKIVDRISGENKGAVGFNNYQAKHRKAEIGYWLLPRFWRQGIVQEVLPVLINYMQNRLHIHRIEALIEEGNKASIESIMRAGFVFEGCMQDCEFKNGRFISLNIYCLIDNRG